MKNLGTLILFLFVMLFSLSDNVKANVKPHLITGLPAKQYLPDSTTFNPAVPTPEAFLGFEVGKWHIRHDQLVAYMYKLAETSERVDIQVTGRTHQDKPLLLLTISHPENKQQLDDIRLTHLENIKKKQRPKPNSPLVFYTGYSIHGNEPSGSNAALVLAYYLAAGSDERINSLLDNAIVLFDPALNPDGLSRFADWANMHKGYQLNASSYHREHNENWPSGRTNYYWFDLNRDWLLLTHPESKARIEQFHKWRPHILTDFHEMATDGTYFFQPGVPSRTNPLTPNENVELTGLLARYHANALDKQNQLYFTEEGFDDFYYGKGSTYPDAHGSVGILFEQARVRGHVQESINGELTFTQTIQNHITTTFSSIDGALENKQRLLNYPASFAKQTDDLIKKEPHDGVVLIQPKDTYRFERLLDKLDAHQIEYDVVTQSTNVEELQIEGNSAVYVSFNQAQYRLIKSIFSQRTSFPDNTFYDVSNWNMPLAFDIDYRVLSSREAKSLSLSQGRERLVKKANAPESSDAVALAFEWHHYQAPALANRLLMNGYTLRVAGKAFSSIIEGEEHEFAAGTVIIPRAFNQNKMSKALDLASEFSLPLWPIQTGLTPKGIDLGSRNMNPLSLPKLLLLGGEGTSEYEVGEIWHYFDTQVGLPVTLIDQEELSRVDLSRFTHIIVADGRYREWDERANSNVEVWLNKGGTLIGQKTALRWFESRDWLDVSIVSQRDIDSAFDTSTMNYADIDDLSSKKRISGAAYMAKVDLTYPLFFGLENDQLAFFKTSNLIVENTQNPFDTFAVYTDEPLIGGYTSDELKEQVAGSASVVVQRRGKGRVIAFVDNVNFRGYWFGTSKLMGNAVFLSDLMN